MGDSEKSPLRKLELQNPTEKIYQKRQITCAGVSAAATRRSSRRPLERSRSEEVKNPKAGSVQTSWPFVAIRCNWQWFLTVSWLITRPWCATGNGSYEWCKRVISSWKLSMIYNHHEPFRPFFAYLREILFQY